jgi:CRISPR-associated protein (Cas_Csd1)
VRVQVRLYLPKKLEQLVHATHAWWKDLAMVLPKAKGTSSVSPVQVLESLQRGWGDSEVMSQQSILVAFWQAVLDPSIPFPNAILIQAVNLIQNSVMTCDFPRAVIERGDTSKILHSRLALLKLALRRTGDSQLQSALNPNHSSPNYQAGRLNALLEQIRMISCPDHDDKTVIHAFGRAIYDPVVTLEPMTRIFQHVLERIATDHPWVAFALENQLEYLWEKLDCTVPPNATADEQALFILGYYHQTVFNQANRQFDRDVMSQELEAVVDDNDQFVLSTAESKKLSRQH